MKIVKEMEPLDSDIIEAIKIRTSECFGAMSIANAMAGYQSNSWYLIRNYSLDELKEEAKKRGLNSVIEDKK